MYLLLYCFPSFAITMRFHMRQNQFCSSKVIDELPLKLEKMSDHVEFSLTISFYHFRDHPINSLIHKRKNNQKTC